MAKKKYLSQNSEVADMIANIQAADSEAKFGPTKDQLKQATFADPEASTLNTDDVIDLTGMTADDIIEAVSSVKINGRDAWYFVGSVAIGGDTNKKEAKRIFLGSFKKRVQPVAEDGTIVGEPVTGSSYNEFRMLGNQYKIIEHLAGKKITVKGVNRSVWQGSFDPETRKFLGRRQTSVIDFVLE